ncbi:MAG: hypothetical protein K0S11_1190 [Gammaproteobacteria bacterium]|jgi:hypothetical protein|nr:hypothetical protein [Gammaproteobacteria bacterium]
MKKLIIASSLSLLLTACATPYQANNFANMSGGYSEHKLNDNLYEVIFVGNGYTSKIDVEEMLLCRCAELTQKNGYKYFYFFGTKDVPATISMANIGKKEAKNQPSGYYAYIAKGVIQMTNKKMEGAIEAESYLKNLEKAKTFFQ